MPIVPPQIAHIMGIGHEQKRRDRDMFVNIHWGSIQAKWVEQYKFAADSDTNRPYNYNSIMHYPRSSALTTPAGDLTLTADV
jgi:hypothetical protein